MSNISCISERLGAMHTNRNFQQSHVWEICSVVVLVMLGALYPQLLIIVGSGWDQNLFSFLLYALVS